MMLTRLPDAPICQNGVEFVKRFVVLRKSSPPTPEALPIPLAIAEGRRALSQMYIDLTLAFYATIFPLDQLPDETDANLSLVAVAVMLGHAEARPMTSSCIAARLKMPRSSVLRRLDLLIKHGLIRRIKDKYYLEPERAKKVPHRDSFELILSRGFAALGPILSEMDT